MSEAGTRPGGLTALAVINFIFAAIYMLGALGLIVGATVAVKHPDAVDQRAESSPESRARALTPEEERAQRDAETIQRTMREKPGLAMLSGGASALLGVLVLVAGIGYLKVRRRMGRSVGLLYALVAIVWGAVEVSYMNKLLDRNFGILNLIGFLYPVVTLVCLQFVFKDDFVNP